VTIYLAIAVLSAATLAYEVLLLRLFAIAQWHHFAYMAISIALLGFGASGTFLFLAQRWLGPRFTLAFAVSSAAFGITALTGFALAQRLPFNALQVVWEPRQLLYLLVLYPLLALPFFAAANCIGLAFGRFGCPSRLTAGNGPVIICALPRTYGPFPSVDKSLVHGGVEGDTGCGDGGLAGFPRMWTTCWRCQAPCFQAATRLAHSGIRQSSGFRCG